MVDGLDIFYRSFPFAEFFRIDQGDLHIVLAFVFWIEMDNSSIRFLLAIPSRSL